MEDMPRYAVGDYVSTIGRPIGPDGCKCNGLHDDKRHKVIKVEYHENTGTWHIKLAGRKQLWSARCFARTIAPPKQEPKLIWHDDLGGKCKDCIEGYAREVNNEFVKSLGLRAPRKHERKTYTFCDDCGAVTVFVRVQVVTHAMTETIIGKFPQARTCFRKK